MADSAGDCPVCMVDFEDTSRRPCTLPCGHSFCDLCINRVKEQNHIRCPTCCVEHDLPEGGQFPINYALEAFMRSVRESSQKDPQGITRAMRSMLQEQEAKVLAAVCTCQMVQAQLDRYQTTLVDWTERQRKLEDRLLALVEESKAARELLQQEGSHVEDKKEQVQQRQQQLHSLLDALRRATTQQEACEAIDDADHRTNEERQRVEECREMFPDLHTFTTVNKVREALSAALEAAATVQAAWETAGAAGHPGSLADLDSSIRLEALLTTTLKAEDLRSLTQTARDLLDAGLVFAVYQEEQQSRHARISHEDGRLYLHHIQDQPQSPRPITVKMEEVMPATTPCVVFLDLTWPGSGRRRVFVHLTPNTQLAHQFLLLCTGQRGPSYANTRLWKVMNSGMPGEGICGGDYENNDGTGGAALFPGLDEGEYRESFRAGAVWGWWRRDPDRGALFGITTRDWHQSVSVPSVFGEVVSGLEDVVVAAQHRPVTEVTVVDCGVVLWE